MSRGTVFHIFAYAAQGKGISGSDRIFIELAKRISRNNTVNIWVTEDGYEMCRRQGLSNEYINFNVTSVEKAKVLGFFINYILRILAGIRLGLTLKLQSDSGKNQIVYSASEFLMDSLPAYILKLRKSGIIWIASWYQTAPSPLRGFSLKQGETRNRMSAIPYWIMQKLAKPYISRFADKICVNNKGELNEFPKHNKDGRMFIMYGAVALEVINVWKKNFKSKTEKKYDAVFQGRFHPQKGVIELIEIWKNVVEKKPDAKLAMIGDGPLMQDVRTKISDLRLVKNIKLFGYVFDGSKKYSIFAGSKIVVHPAFYDSGGMATAEAMAFGLPAVGFNLPSYEDYYPSGMVKVPMVNKSLFSKAIVRLLTDDKYYGKMSRESLLTINKNWSWESRYKDFWNFATK